MRVLLDNEPWRVTRLSIRPATADDLSQWPEAIPGETRIETVDLEPI